jgi:hypothetical protein
MWPFSKIQLNIKTLPLVTDDTEKWTVAQGEIDGTPLIIRYNSSARQWQGHSELPIKVGFAIPLNSPNEGGLPSPEENEQINDIEDVIDREVAARTPAVKALVIANGIMKEFIFYVPRAAGIQAIHEAVQAAATTHEVQCIGVHDPKWTTYEEFRPE